MLNLDREEFIERVLHSAPPHARPYAEKTAKEWFDAKGVQDMYWPDIAGAVSLAGVIADEIKTTQQTPVETVTLDPGPDNSLRSGQLIQLLGPKVKALRVKLFGSGTPSSQPAMDSTAYGCSTHRCVLTTPTAAPPRRC